MLAAIALGAFLPILLVTTLSLWVRRAHPGVGAVAGGMVIALLAVTMLASLHPFFAPQPDDPNIAYVANATERYGRALLNLFRLLLVIGVLSFLASAMGWVQSRVARIPLGLAIVGGFGELCLAAIVLSYLMWEGFLQGPAPLSDGLKWVLGPEWLVAECVAPFFVRRLKQKRGFSNSREAPHEFAAF